MDGKQLSLIESVRGTNNNERVQMDLDDGGKSNGVEKVREQPAKLEKNIVVVCSGCGTKMQSHGVITGGNERAEIDGTEYNFTVRTDLFRCHFDDCPHNGTVNLHANQMMRVQDPEKVIQNRKTIGDIDEPFHDVIRVEDEIGGPHFVTTTESLSSTEVDGERVDIVEEESHIELADE